MLQKRGSQIETRLQSGKGLSKKQFFFRPDFCFADDEKYGHEQSHLYMSYIYKLYICVGYIRIVYDSVKKPPENQLCYFNNLTFFLLSEPHLCRPPWPYVAPSTRLATPCMSKLNPHLQAEEWNSWGHPASAWSPVQQQFLGHGGGQTIMGMKVMSGKDIFGFRDADNVPLCGGYTFADSCAWLMMCESHSATLMYSCVGQQNVRSVS